jgi:aminoglycoside 6-adenylyltransferase
LSSSRTNPTVPELIDQLSDYDIDVIITGEARAWYDDRSWLEEEFGRVLVGFIEPPALEYGIEDFGGVIIYESGVKIDYTILPVSIFAQVVSEPRLRGGWDDGHRVLLDKDGMAAKMSQPTHREFIPSPPRAEAYRDVIDHFFTDTTYVAKNLWRDELMFMKSVLDQYMKGECLLKMLEWRMEMDHGWAVRLGLHGRGLKKRLPADLWAELEQTYVGAGSEENWAALFRTIALFRRVASEVGAHLGYAYPAELEERVVAYLNWIRYLERPAL